MQTIYAGFMGKGNCGKGTQAKLLAEKYNLKIISTGNLLREWALKGPEDFWANRINEDIDKGILIPSAVVFYLWFSSLLKLETTQGVVFEGSPRYLIEGQAMVEVFSWMKNNKFFVFNLDIPDEESLYRSSIRRYCPACHKTYSLDFDPGITHCKDDNTELIIRDDDKPEVIKKRIEEFNRSVVPTMNYLREQGVLYDINGVGSVEEIFNNIDKIIKENI